MRSAMQQLSPLPPLVTPLWVFFKDVGRQTQLSYFGAILYMHQQNGVFQ